MCVYFRKNRLGKKTPTLHLKPLNWLLHVKGLNVNAFGTPVSLYFPATCHVFVFNIYATKQNYKRRATSNCTYASVRRRRHYILHNYCKLSVFLSFFANMWVFLLYNNLFCIIIIIRSMAIKNGPLHSA